MLLEHMVWGNNHIYDARKNEKNWNICGYRIPLFQLIIFFPFLISAPSVGSVGRIWTSVEIPILKEVRTHVLLRLAIPHDLPRAHSDQNEESCSRWAGSASRA